MSVGVPQPYRAAPFWGRSLRYVLYFGVIREGRHGGGRFRGFARNDNRAAKRPGFREFRRFRGCGIAYGDDYKVSVTGLPLVSPVLHDEEQKAPSLGRSLRYVLYFGVIGEGGHGAGRFLDFASLRSK